MMNVVAEEKFLNLKVDTPTKDQWDATLSDMGMTSREATTRLVRWFCEQDASVRYAILGPPALRRDIAESVLRRFIEQSEAADAEALEADLERESPTDQAPARRTRRGA